MTPLNINTYSFTREMQPHEIKHLEKLFNSKFLTQEKVGRVWQITLQYRG